MKPAPAFVTNICPFADVSMMIKGGPWQKTWLLAYGKGILHIYPLDGLPV